MRTSSRKSRAGLALSSGPPGLNSPVLKKPCPLHSRFACGLFWLNSGSGMGIVVVSRWLANNGVFASDPDSKSDRAGLVPAPHVLRADGAIFVALSLDSLQLLMY